MPNEVSCKVFAIMLAPLAAKGVALGDVVKGTSLVLAILTDRSARIDWADYVTIMANLHPHFSDDERREIGRQYMRAPGLRFASVIARLLFTPMDFYRWANKPREGIGNQMFSHIRPTHRELGGGVIELDLEMPEGYEMCQDFFVISSGNLEEFPRFVGAKRAKLEMSWLPRGARYRIQVPTRVPFLWRVWRAITWPFTARAAARELRAAHESLLDRYQELDAAKGELANYQVNLEKLVEQRTAELQKARDELAGTVDQLHEAQAAQERFFGNISHEIRTPLSLIMLSVADIERRAGRMLDARSGQSLASVQEAARKLVRLVDELLLLAAGQAGKFELHREPTDLAALVDQLVAAWRPATEAAGQELVAITTPTLLANIDPIAFERIASNLISNAVKYTPRGGRIEVELSGASAISFCVRDTGPGIDAELATRLFGRFERGAHEQIKGTGIGLSLVKQLVEAHGGQITVTARVPHGTEMAVAMPLTGESDATVRVRGLALPAPTGDRFVTDGQKFAPHGTSHGTIVLAEDDAQLARATAELLADKYTVYIGLDGESALALVKQHRPQLLVTDIEMPRMNGIELARAFREAVGDQLAPIIMLSAVIDLGTRIAGLEAGAIDYVTKPFDAREFLARVDSQFAMRELAVRLQEVEQLSTLGILTSGLAHELRNPANGIVNAIAPLTDMLPPELVGPDTGPGQLLEVMAGCAEQIRFLSTQLLGFRKGMQLEVRAVAFSDVIRRSIAVASSATADIEVRTKLTVVHDVMCSAPLLVQALTNLIENAGHAAGRGGWIEVSTWTENGKISVEVADSGPGVPVALREKIFQPFFTTKAPGQGTGLGLAMARAIAQRHGGMLEIRERSGRAAFVIELPEQSTAGAISGRYTGVEAS